MKIIDLYKKMANKEEMPKKIICNDSTWVYSKTLEDYISVDRYLFKNPEFYNMTYFLNLEVKIIEEKPKKIEKFIKTDVIYEDSSTMPSYICKQKYDYTSEEIFEKLNEVIDNLNYLLEKSDSE